MKKKIVFFPPTKLPDTKKRLKTKPKCPKTYTCENCGLEFTAKKTLKEHLGAEIDELQNDMGTCIDQLEELTNEPYDPKT